MISLYRSGIWMAVFAALSLAACGGSDSPAPLAGGGTGGTGISAGPISAFGSVYVNGTRYNSSETTEIFVNDVSAMEDDLDVGMIVRVLYRENNGRFDALRIEYASGLEGLVTENAVDPLTGAGSLTVMGQVVSADTITVYRDNGIVERANLADLQPGDSVEVSGFTSGSGALAATRIELESVGSQGPISSEIAAVIDSLVPSGFLIGALLVTYDSMTAFEDGLTAGGLVPGLHVKVKGETSDGVALAAQSIRAIDDLISGDAGEEFEFHGFVTSRTVNTLTISGIDVLLTASTVCQPGVNCATIDNGDRVEVHGRFNSSGERVAEEVEIKAALATEEFEGTVAAVILDGTGDPNTGTLTVLDEGMAVEFAVTAGTIMFDDDSEISLNLSQLSPGNFVKVYAHAGGNGWIATKVKREDDTGGASVDNDG